MNGTTATLNTGAVTGGCRTLLRLEGLTQGDQVVVLGGVGLSREAVGGLT